MVGKASEVVGVACQSVLNSGGAHCVLCVVR